MGRAYPCTFFPQASPTPDPEASSLYKSPQSGRYISICLFISVHLILYYFPPQTGEVMRANPILSWQLQIREANWNNEKKRTIGAETIWTANDRHSILNTAACQKELIDRQVVSFYKLEIRICRRLTITLTVSIIINYRQYGRGFLSTRESVSDRMHGLWPSLKKGIKKLKHRVGFH